MTGKCSAIRLETVTPWRNTRFAEVAEGNHVLDPTPVALVPRVIQTKLVSHHLQGFGVGCLPEPGKGYVSGMIAMMTKIMRDTPIRVGTAIAVRRAMYCFIIRRVDHK